MAWVLFLPPFSLLRGDSRQVAGDGYSVKVAGSVPAVPAGLTPASKYYQIYTQKSGGPAVSISLPLLDPRSNNRGVSFYTFKGGWQRVAPADLAPDGSSAQGQLQSLPNNLILLKRQGNAGQVMGALPAGKTLSPEAAQQLTMLNPSGFAPSGDGSVNGEEPPAIPGAQYDVVPAVVAQSGDSAQAVTDILSAADKQSAHVSALAALAGRPGNAGVELDYTAVSPQQRQAFTDFVGALAQELHKAHRTLGLELPAPSLSGSGWNSGAYDWSALAKSVDYLKLLPALDQSVYRKQMPGMLKYLTSDAGVDPRKLVLVTSAYSTEKTDTDTRILSRLSALSIASQIQIQNASDAAASSNVTLVAANLNHDTGGSGLVWDGTTATVSFVYKVGDATHVVWIENRFSEGFKLQYVQLYHLGGVAVDDASNDPAIGDPWPAIAQFAATGSPVLQQPNPGLLAPAWLADGNPLSSDGKTVFTWQAPSQAGDHTISLIVSDGDVRVIGSTQVTLKPAGSATSTGGTGTGALLTATPRAGLLTATPASRSAVASPTPGR